MGQLEVCETPRAMSSTAAQATTPIPENGTVPPRPVPQAQRRPREYLTPNEVERLIAAARQNRLSTGSHRGGSRRVRCTQACFD
jgi:hypothetical protein